MAGAIGYRLQPQRAYALDDCGWPQPISAIDRADGIGKELTFEASVRGRRSGGRVRHAVVPGQVAATIPLAGGRSKYPTEVDVSPGAVGARGAAQ